MEIQAGLVTAARDTPSLPTVNGLRNSPTRRFPSELISEIFLNSLPTDCYARPSIHESPLVLGRVCRLWRSIMLSTPRLWTQIHIGSTDDFRSIDLDSRALEEWISRSRSCPLSIKLGIHSAAVEQLIEQILPLVERWESIDISSQKSRITPLIAALQRGAPMLRTLRIRSSYDYIPWEVAAKALNLSALPQLRRLELGPESYIPDFVSIRHNMRDLRLDSCVSINECLQCLELCPLVESVAVTFYGRQNYPSSNTPLMLELHRLHSLRLTVPFAPRRISKDNPRLFLDVLRLPSLQSLTLDIDFHPMPEPWTPLSALLQRSKACLKKLEINLSPFGEETVFDCLKSMPDLESLAVRGTVLTYATMIALTHRRNFDPDDDKAYFCPRLKHVAFYSMHPSKLNQLPGHITNRLIQMIMRRWSPHPAEDRPPPRDMNLRSIKVRWRDYDALSKLPEMERFIEEGFKLVLDQTEEDD